MHSVGRIGLLLSLKKLSLEGFIPKNEATDRSVSTRRTLISIGIEFVKIRSGFSLMPVLGTLERRRLPWKCAGLV